MKTTTPNSMRGILNRRRSMLFLLWMALQAHLVVSDSGSLRDRNKPNAFAVSPYPSNFTCRHKPPGYYADMFLGCEVYHLCNRHGTGMAFECPRGTKFQQRTMVCDHARMVKCQDSAKFYHNNLRIGHKNLKLIDDDGDSSNNVYMQVMVKKNSRRKNANKQISNHRVTQTNRSPKQFQVVVKESKSNVHHQHSETESKLRRAKKPSRHFKQFQSDRKRPKDQNDVKSDFFSFFSDGETFPKSKRPARKFTKSKFPNFPVQDAFKGHHNNIPKGHLDLSRKNPQKKQQTKPIYIPLTQRLLPPRKHAPVADFQGPGLKTQNHQESKSKKSDVVVKAIPPRAKVIGIKPLRPLALSNREKNSKVLTLKQFLKFFPENREVHMIPIPVDGKEADMIKHLARGNHPTLLGSQKGHHDDHLLKELDNLIATRSSRKIRPVIFKRVPVRPRGKDPSKWITKQVKDELSQLTPPKLEFGFVPLTSTTPAQPPPVTSSLADPKDPKTITEEAFFFTTTEAAKTDPEPPNETNKRKKKKKSRLSDLFDMRNLFYIPPEKKSKFQTQFKP